MNVVSYVYIANLLFPHCPRCAHCCSFYSVLSVIISSRDFLFLFYSAFVTFPLLRRGSLSYSLSLFRLSRAEVCYDSLFRDGETVSEHEKIMFRWVRICDLTRFNANNDAIICPDIVDWIRARALMSQMQRQNVNVIRARRHVKFVRGKASVRTCLCTCVNDRAKSVDENEYARVSVCAIN